MPARGVIAALILLLLTACGIKGDLYLPPEPEQEQEQEAGG